LDAFDGVEHRVWGSQRREGVDWEGL